MLTLHKSGIYTTVQDRGRFWASHMGIPSAGAMDRKSADLVNLILGNDRNDALLECTFNGPQIEFHSPTLIAIVGADLPAYLNGNSIAISKAQPIKPGDQLSFGRMAAGCRIYIGVKGGLLSPKIYHSRSACLTAGILHRLSNGDQLAYQPYDTIPSSTVSLRRDLTSKVINVYKGPEFEKFKDDQIQQLTNTNLTISPESNRMAFHIIHGCDLSHNISMLSSGTLPGTVQVTPSGQLNILMRDTQTTGGYPRIFQLAQSSIDDISQMPIGAPFRFSLVQY